MRDSTMGTVERQDVLSLTLAYPRRAHSDRSLG